MYVMMNSNSKITLAVRETTACNITDMVNDWNKVIRLVFPDQGFMQRFWFILMVSLTASTFQHGLEDQFFFFFFFVGVSV